MPEHHRAADDLDAVADEHHPPLRHRVGEGADESGKRDVRDREKGLQQRIVPVRRNACRAARDGDDEQALSASAEKNCAAMMM
jgi:hypothetical protein